MKKLLLLFTILFLTYIPAYGDDGVLGGKGNTVYPIYDTSVKMLGENVYIKIKDGKSYVSCEFLFQSTGKGERLMVGFPAYGTVPQEEREEFNDDLKLYDFKTYVDGKEVTTVIKKGLNEEGNNSGGLFYPNWHVWDMSFKENEVHRVMNTYWVYNSRDFMGGELIEYILRTGATWKDTINYGKITMQFDITFDPQDINLMNYKAYNNSNNLVVYVLPEEKKLIWEFFDLEPGFDVGVYFRDNKALKKNYFLEVSAAYFDAKEKQTIYDLGKSAYDSYTKGEYDASLNEIRKIEEFKGHDDHRISEYALQIINWLDYYRAMMYMEKGDLKQAEYYFKISGILEDNNYYSLTQLYKISGDTDKYIQSLNRIIKGRFTNQAIVPWALQEYKLLPAALKEKYQLDWQEQQIVIENVEDDKDDKEDAEISISLKNDFKPKPFILINMGIFMFILVIYWNIRKRS